MATPADIAEILARLSSRYPTFQYSDGLKHDWMLAFGNTPTLDLLAAIEHYSKHNNTPYAPIVDQLFAALRELKAPRVPKFTGLPPATLSEELGKRQMAEARAKHPHLYAASSASSLQKRERTSAPDETADWDAILGVLELKNGTRR